MVQDFKIYEYPILTFGSNIQPRVESRRLEWEWGGKNTPLAPFKKKKKEHYNKTIILIVRFSIGKSMSIYLVLEL